MREYMEIAFHEAKLAFEENEVPVGAVIIKNDEVIAKNHNRVIANNDPTCHAEMLVIKDACNKLKSRHLNECEIYITLEPCPMCAGAILNSKIRKIIYALDELNFGSLGSYINLKTNPHFKNAEIYAGIMEKECKKLMHEYFKRLREKNL